MFTAGNEAGGFRRNRRNNLKFITVQRAQAAANNEIILIIILIIVQYLFKFLKFYISDTYKKQREKFKAFLYQLDLFFKFNIDKFLTDKNKVLFITTYIREPAFE